MWSFLRRMLRRKGVRETRAAPAPARLASTNGSRLPLAEYNITDARNRFSYLLTRVRHGESVVIARHGEPIATLVPYFDTAARRPGLVHARLSMTDMIAVERSAASRAQEN
jgi:prevent-host-death family protein